MKIDLSRAQRGVAYNAVDLSRVRNLADTARTKAQQQQRERGKSWYRIANASGASGPAEIMIYDLIGEWGVSAQDFVNELRQVTASSIDLHVNSEGGEVFDGLAIYEALVRHKASVDAYVDGLAASAASFIVMAADKIIMAPRARMMIHDAHGVAWGNPRDMRSMADLLDELSDTIADIYAERAGGTRQQWRTAMQAAQGGPDGTWYDAQDAVKAGLADEVARSGDAPEDRTGTASTAPTVARPAARPVKIAAADIDVDTFASAWSGAMSAFEEIDRGPVRMPDAQTMRDLIDIT